ncbi:MAG: sigma-E processing peptidase SpoIIGA [Ruminococcus sp.]|nr:sigma-E processing peptidase SpoIIGA [Ruminococcus sp.]
MQTIYVDVLIVLNIYVNCILLKTTAKLTHTPLKNIRCIVSSAYGSLFSLLILAPELGTPINLLIKSFAAVTIVITAFGKDSPKRIMINTAYFFGVNFIFAGAVYGVYSWLKPDFMHFSNTYFYIDFSLIVLLATTAALYGIVCVLRRISDNGRYTDCKYRVVIKYGGKEVECEGLADTGNGLIDFFSGQPVIICGNEDFSRLTGYENGRDILPRGCRLVPCSTVSDSGLMAIFRPDEIKIINGYSGEEKPVEAMVGSGHSGGKAIFNPKIL